MLLMRRDQDGGATKRTGAKKISAMNEAYLSG
jgi:hypothetical protein